MALTLRQKLAESDSEQWIKSLALYIGMAEDEIDEIAVFDHYFTITCYNHTLRIEMFENGYLELYGSNAGVNIVKLLEYMKDINWIK